MRVDEVPNLFRRIRAASAHVLANHVQEEQAPSNYVDPHPGLRCISFADAAVAASCPDLFEQQSLRRVACLYCASILESAHATRNA
jgi:hypothetical protein